MNEPNIRNGKKAVSMWGVLTIEGLVKGKKYVIYRYNDVEKVPSSQF